MKDPNRNSSQVLILPFDKLSAKDADIAGGKGASLGEMTNAGIPVPPGFVILSATFERFVKEAHLNPEIDAILDSVDHKEIRTVEDASEKIQALIHNVEMPEDIGAAITECFKELNSAFVAVRSSATSEDSADAAWAGQLDTYLNTTEGNLLENVKRCWASLFTPRAIFYRFEKGLHKQVISVAVVVQKMVESEVSGIAFSVHPVTQDYNQMIIEAGLGLGEAIVSGSITPDSYVVEKKPLRIIDKAVTAQKRAMVRGEMGGSVWQDLLNREGEAQTLTDEQIIALAHIIIRIEQHYGFPCDIEWAYEQGEFYVVQSRPITTLTKIESESNANQDDLTQTGMAGGYTLDEVLQRMKTKKRWYSKSYSGYPFGLAQQGMSIAHGETATPYAIPYGLFFQNHNKIDHFDWFWDSELLIERREKILTKAKEDATFAADFYEIWKKKWDIFLERWEIVARINLSSFSPDVIREKLVPIHNAIVDHASYSYVVDTFLSDSEDDWLEQAIKGELGAAAVPEVVATLTAPVYESFVNEFEVRKLKIAERINQGEVMEVLLTECEAIARDFFWVRANYHSYVRLTSKDIYQEAAEEAKKLGEDVAVKISEEKTRTLENRRKKTVLIKKLGVSEDLRRVIEISEVFTHIQDKRKEGVLRGNCLFYEALAVTAAKLTIDHELMFYITPLEFLDKGKFEAIDWEVIRLRREKGVLLIFCHEECYPIPRADYEKQIPLEHFFASSFGIREVRGAVAYKGIVRGVARVVSSISEIQTFNEGDILIANQTTPEYVPAMKKAVAFVTDQGGITCHAAIIAREMKKPCVIGTKIATQVIKTGDLIEVDANNGIVTITKSVAENGSVLPHWEKVLQRNFPPLAWTAGGYYEFNGLTIGPMTWKREREMHIRYRTAQSYMIQDPAAYYISNIKDVIEEINESFEEVVDEYNQEIYAAVRIQPGKTLDDLRRLNDLHRWTYGLMLVGFDVAIDVKNRIDEVILKKDEGFEPYLVTPWKQTGVGREQVAIAEAKRIVKKDPASSSDVIEHLSLDFGYLHQDYLGKPWLPEDYAKALHDSISLQSHMDDTYDVSTLSPYDQWLITIFKKMIYMYEEGRNAMVRCVWAMKETVEILGGDPEVLLYMTDKEVTAFASGKGKMISGDLLEKRKEAFALYFENGSYHEYTGNEEVKKLILEQDIMRFWEESAESESVLKGTVAFKGKVQGKVRLVFTQADANAVEEGEIIVAPMTQVEFLSGIRKCGAIVTDEGGIISHAAIVSREFGKPCILATQKATKVLKTGDFVEVDAHNGIVRVITNG